MDNFGYFLLSFDTELATGRFDRDEIRRKMYSSNGERERQSISRLIDLCEEYNIIGTWAVVGHLFFDQCAYCEPCPMLDWKGRYSSFEEIYGTKNSLWYGADIIETLLSKGIHQEIAFHGFSHKLFDEEKMSLREANIEIQTWLRLAKKKGIVPHAVTFPRNQAGYMDELKEAGFICYRGKPYISGLDNRSFSGKFLKTFDHLFGITEIPIFDITPLNNHDFVNLQASQYLFDFNRKFELILDALNLHNLRVERIIRGIKKAAQTKKMLHIWAHPCEFTTEKDFNKLRHIFDAVSIEIKKGQMRSVGMTEMAEILINDHQPLINNKLVERIFSTSK